MKSEFTGYVLMGTRYAKFLANGAGSLTKSIESAKIYTTKAQAQAELNKAKERWSCKDEYQGTYENMLARKDKYKIHKVVRSYELLTEA